MSINQRILKYLTKQLLNKFLRSYSKQFGQNLSVILVTGNVGKSSQTLMLNQIFEKGRYQVFSGTGLKRGLNSLAGISMILLRYDFNLEGKQFVAKFFAAVNFYLKIVFKIIFPSFKITRKSIIIYEIGYDHQGESELFEGLFPSIDLLLCTNFAWEHSGGFSENFNQNAFDKVKNFLPIDLAKKLLDPKIPPKLSNIALEQLTLLDQSKLAILPSDVEQLSNKYVIYSADEIDQILYKEPISIRGNDLELVVNNKWRTSPNYLLPLTFTKTVSVAIEVAKLFQIDDSIIEQSLQNTILPQSRFSRLAGINNTTLIDSTYNSDPASVYGFLENIEEVITKFENTEYLESKNLSSAPRHYLILGEMRELGEMATQKHLEALQEIMDIVSKNPYAFEDILLLGNEWLKCNDEIIKQDGNLNWIRVHGANWKVFSKAGDINDYLDKNEVRPGSWLWLKGSQNTIFLEIVVEHLLKNKSDSSKLCRRGVEWEKVREKWR